MLVQIAIGLAINLTSLLVAGLFILAASGRIQAARTWVLGPNKALRFCVVLILTALWLQLSAAFAIGLWAAAFMGLGLFTGTETAVYFSLVSFTTLGFGDVLLDQNWRLLSGFAAANGFLLFGIYTAFLAEAMRELRQAQLNWHTPHE